MAKSVNRIYLLGNVGNAPEFRTTKSGIALATVSLATNERLKDKQGNWQDRTEWHTVLCYGRTGEIARDYLHKGSKLYVEGRIRTDKWDDKNTGQKHYRTYIVANDVVLLDRAERHEAPDDFAPASAKPKTLDEKLTEPFPDEVGADDIPF